jgi:PhnB protein
MRRKATIVSYRNEVGLNHRQLPRARDRCFCQDTPTDGGKGVGHARTTVSELRWPDEALAFYKKVLGADATMLMRFKDAPDKSIISPGSENKVMHAQVQVGDTTVLMSDGRNTGKPNFQSIALTISANTEAEADRIFAGLADGGQVQMPLGKTFSRRASAWWPINSVSAG